MTWFRNISTEVRHLFGHGQSVGPGGEFEWPEWDHAKHGVVTGFAPLDGPEGNVVPYPERKPAAAAGTGETPASSTTPPAPVKANGNGTPPAGDPPETAGTAPGSKPAGETA